MYHVILYLPHMAVVATEDGSLNGEPLLFDSLQDADNYGQGKPFLYEAVEV